MLSDCNTSIPTVDGKPKGCFLFKKYVLTVYYVPSIVPATIFFSICCREKCLFKNFKILCIPALTKSIFKLYWHVPEPLRIHLFPHYIYIFSFNILLTLLLSLSSPGAMKAKSPLPKRRKLSTMCSSFKTISTPFHSLWPKKGERVKDNISELFSVITKCCQLLFKVSQLIYNSQESWVWIPACQ